MSGPGVAPAPAIAPGQAEYQKLVSGGFSADEANQWRLQQTQKLMGAGFTQPDIDKYWGDQQPNTTQLDAMNRGNPAIHTATNPLEELEAGWQMSVAGLGLRGKVPDTVAPENASLFGKMLNATGQFAGDLPATALGFIWGGSAGATAGAAVPVAGETGASEAVGGLAGGGFGSAAVPQAMREAMIDAYNRGEIHSFHDFWTMATKSVWNTAKAGVVGMASSLVGGKVGGQVLQATAKPWLATGANMTGQALTATAVGGALDGRVPNADDFVAGAAVMLGFHAAGSMVGGRYVPTEATRRVQANLQDIYRRTGTTPWDVVKAAQTDPVIRQEVMAQDVGGNPVTPTLNKAAGDEPPLPKGGTALFPANGKEGVNDNAAAPLHDLLNKVAGLEGSAQYAKAHGISEDQVVSRAGAIGKYQITPGTARQYGFDPSKLTDPEYNETVAIHVLADLWRRFRGDEGAVLAAYNAGPGTAAKLITAGPGTRLVATDGPHGWTYQKEQSNRSEAGLPLETQEYLARGRAAGGGQGGGKEPPAGGGGGGADEVPPGSNSGRPPAELNTEERVANFMDRVGQPSTAHRSMLGGLEMELDAARRVDNALKEQGLLDPKTQISIEDMARSTYASENRANHFFFRGPIDPVTFAEKPGTTLKDVADEITSIGGNKDEFNAYRVSLRTIEKAKQGITAGVIPLDEAKANVADPNLAKYAKANDLMQQFKHGVLEYVRDSGGISQKQMDTIEAANTSHVSLRRIMGDDQAFKGRPGFLRNKSPIQKMEGSSRQIVDPWQADIDNARMMIRFADRNRAAGAIANLTPEALDAAGIRKLPKATIAEPGSDKFEPYGMTEKEAAAFKPFVKAGADKSEGDTSFTYWRNGKPEPFATDDPNLARLYRAADTPGEANLISKAAQIPAAIARAGIALDPSFGPRIALKHQITAFIADPQHPPPFITMLRGILDAFGKGDAFWELARTGGLSGSLVDMDKNVIQTEAQKLLDETGVAKRVWNTVTSPLQFSQMVSDRLSMASRIGYYKQATAQDIAPMKAAMMARKAYLDYDERFIGGIANTWAKFVPFFKADILGIKQGWEAIQPGRLPQTAIYAALGIVLPSIALYVANRQADKNLPDGYKYTDLPQWQRDLYFVSPPIMGTRLRLGKPYNFGPLLGVPLERFLESQYEDDPHAWDGMFREMTDPLPLSLPPAVTPIIEGASNYSFFAGKPLIPDSLKDRTPDLQFNESTTEPGKALARLLGPHEGGLGLANVSPIVIDNYVTAWTGTLGMDAMRAVGAPFKTDSQPWQMSDIPFVHSFVVRNPGSSAQEIQDFYTDLNAVEQKHANTVYAIAKGDMSVLQQDDQGQLLQRLERFSAAIKTMHSVVDGINANDTMTTDEKQQQTDRIYGDMIAISKMGSKIARSIK